MKRRNEREIHEKRKREGMERRNEEKDLKVIR